eukprot:1159709-Pelagomonas_calceolata.AAC.2
MRSMGKVTSSADSRSDLMVRVVRGGSVMPTGPVSRPQAAPIGSYSIIEPWVTGSPALLYGEVEGLLLLAGGKEIVILISSAFSKFDPCKCIMSYALLLAAAQRCANRAHSGPGAIAEEPAAAIPPEALPLAEAAMKVLRSKSLAYMHPDVCFHSDGVLHHKDLVGVNSYVSSMAAAARTYQLVELRPLVVPAVDLGRRVAFVLSSFKLKHRATSRCAAASNKEGSIFSLHTISRLRLCSVSHGIQVDAVRFDEGCKITDVWVRRQLTVEEREIMLKGGPASHPGAVFDETAIEVRVILCSCAMHSQASKMNVLAYVLHVGLLLNKCESAKDKGPLSADAATCAFLGSCYSLRELAPGAEEVGDRTPEAMAQAAAAAGVSLGLLMVSRTMVLIANSHVPVLAY